MERKELTTKGPPAPGTFFGVSAGGIPPSGRDLPPRRDPITRPPVKKPFGPPVRKIPGAVPSLPSTPRKETDGDTSPRGGRHFNAESKDAVDDLMTELRSTASRPSMVTDKGAEA